MYAGFLGLFFGLFPLGYFVCCFLWVVLLVGYFGLFCLACTDVGSEDHNQRELKLDISELKYPFVVPLLSSHMIVPE